MKWNTVLKRKYSSKWAESIEEGLCISMYAFIHWNPSFSGYQIEIAYNEEHGWERNYINATCLFSTCAAEWDWYDGRGARVSWGILITSRWVSK